MQFFDLHRHYHITEGDLEEYIEQARRANVTKVGMSTCGPLFNQYDNEGVLRAMGKYPDLIVGFGYIRLGQDGSQKVDQLYAQGFRALKAIIPTTFYDDHSLWPIYERAEALGMPINFHCGITGPLRNSKGHHTSSRYQRPICLDAIARDSPDLDIIMPHLGFPWVQEACGVIAAFPNIYWDLTGGALLRCNAEWLREKFLIQGEESWEKMLDRLVWASDTSPPGQLIDRYEEIFDLMEVSAEQRQQAYWTNAAEMFDLD